jgi:hypothetical protein
VPPYLFQSVDTALSKPYFLVCLMPGVAGPLPEDQANGVLEDKGPTVVEDVERAIGPPGGFFGEEFSQETVAGRWSFGRGASGKDPAKMTNTQARLAGA